MPLLIYGKDIERETVLLTKRGLSCVEQAIANLEAVRADLLLYKGDFGRISRWLRSEGFTRLADDIQGCEDNLQRVKRIKKEQDKK